MLRFMAYVDRAGPAKSPALGPCHLWTGTTTIGYGRFRFEGRMVRAHRYAFFLAHGRWPTPEALHLCDTKTCVNPAHLIEGTHAQNMADAKARGLLVQIQGERHGSAKLTASQVAEIRSARPAIALKVLAAKYGVSKSLISQIASDQVWLPSGVKGPRSHG